MDYYVDSSFSHFDKNTPEGKKEIAKIVLPAIKRLQNKIEQSFWIQKISGMLGIKEEAVAEELAKIKEEKYFQESAGKTEKTPSLAISKETSEGQRKKLIEDRIIALVLKNPNYAMSLQDDDYKLFSKETDQFLKEAKKFAAAPPIAKEATEVQDLKELEQDSQNLLKNISTSLELDDEFKNYLATLAIASDLHNYNEKEGKDELMLCIFQLKNIELRNKLNQISQDIKQAEFDKDPQKVNNLIEKFNTLSKDLSKS
jgi:DNA primase